MPPALEEWTKDELIAAIRSLERQPWTAANVADAESVLHELRVHQIELEMQNRELREAQQQLEESRSRYADLYDLAPIGYCTLDRQGVVREANLEATRLLGTNRAYLAGRPLTAVVNTDVRRFHAHLDRCLTKQERVTCQLELTRLNETNGSTGAGSSLIVQMVSTPIAQVGAKATLCMTALTDVSELKSSERRLRLLSLVSERLGASLDYRASLPAVAALVVPLLADLAFIDVVAVGDSQPGERFGRLGAQPLVDYDRTPQAEVLRTRSPLVVEGATGATLRAVLGVSAPSERNVAYAERGALLLLPLIARRRALGVLTLVLAPSSRGYSAAELQLGYEVAARVAMALENAQLYEGAQEAIRAREDIVAVVSHDLHNPLHGMRLNCDYLLEIAQADGQRAGRQQLEAIRRGIDRMWQMIRQLSEMARIEAGHLTLERGVHSVDALVGDALDLLRPLAEKKRLSIEPPSPQPSLAVSADRDRVLQVLSNLLGNALKFSPAGERVTIAVTVDGARGVARVAVTDRGPGIAPAQLSHIFERYWRSEERRRGGSGLGLYIAKSIVDAHGGQIGVDSELDRGTTVWFTLPIAPAVAPAPPARRREAPDAPAAVIDHEHS